MTKNTGAAGFRTNRYLVLFFTLIIILAGVLPFVTVAGNQNIVNEDPSTDDSTSSARGRSRASLIVTSDKTLTTKATYDSIWVENGTLTIDDGITITVNGILNVSGEGSVIIKGIIRPWSVNAHCKSFTLPGGYLECKNGKTFSGEAPESQVIIHTENSIELSNQALIKCTGPSGAPRSDGKGHRAGDSIIELMSDSYISITEDSTVNSIGGVGVKGTAPYGGGDGGYAYLTLQANASNSNSNVSILIQEATISAQGGSGGTYSDSSSIPGNGGTSQLKITSASNNNKDKIEIERSAITSKGGNGGIGFTIPGNPGGSDIDVKCKNNFYIDGYKTNDKDDWLDADGTEITLGDPDGTPAFTIEAPKGAHIYTPKPEGLAGYIKAKDSQSVINIYYMLDVQVEDYSETPIPNSDVQIKMASTTIKSDKTDNNGKVSFLLPAYQITRDAQGENGLLNYGASAGISGTSAESEYQGDILLEKRYNSIEIYISLVLVNITKVMFGGDTYLSPEEGLEVAGEVTVIGTASSGFGTIHSVEVDEKQGMVSNNKGVATSIANNFAEWSYTFDTKSYVDEAIITIEATASDGTFSNMNFIDLTVNNELKKDPPTLIIVTPKENDIFIDDEVTSRQKIEISGITSDPDFGSTVLSDSNDIDEVSITIKNEAGETIEIENSKTTIRLTTDSPRNDRFLRQYLKTPIYNWSYNWSTSKAIEGSDGLEWKYPEGKYTITVTATDNTKPTPLSVTRSVTFSLRHNGRIPSNKPVAVVVKINKDDDPEYDEIKKEAEYKFKSEKGKDKVYLIVDLSGSDDEGGNVDDLMYKIDEYGPSDWQNSSLVTIEFLEYEKKTVSYNITVRVKDPYGWENDRTFVIKKGAKEEVYTLEITIEYLPADQPPKGPLAELTGISIDNSNNEFIFIIIFVILLILFDVTAVVLITQKYKKIENRRKSREVALDTARQKTMAAAEESKADIYSHIQYVEEEGGGEIAVAGASVAMDLPTEDFSGASISDLANPAEPEAPKLVSAGEPIFESDVPATGAQVPAAAPEPAIETPPLDAPAPIPALPPAPAQAQPAAVQVQPAQIASVPTPPVAAQPAQSATAPPAAAAQPAQVQPATAQPATAQPTTQTTVDE